MYNFDLTFFKRFWRVLVITFPKVKSITVLLFVALLAIVVLEQVMAYLVGLLPSKFYKVLGDKDLKGFQIHTIKSIAIVIGMALVVSTKKYLASVFYVTSRGMLTKHLHNSYFTDIVYYQLNVVENSIDNPDQRITQDVSKMCKTFAEIIPSLLISPFTIAYYTYQTWISTGYMGPLTVFIFFIVFTISNKLLMSSVIGLVYKQERMEGDFRYKHMMLRSNAESAAFYRCGEVELLKTSEKLNRLLNTQQRLNVRQFLLSLSTGLADYLGSILSYIMIAIPLFAGAYDQLSPSELSQLISQNAFITIYLIFCFTKLIDMALQVSDIAGTTHRIIQIAERMDELKKSMKEMNSYTRRTSDCWSSDMEQVVAYRVENLTYRAPGSNDAAALVSGMSLELRQHVNVLITGDSGCGKSSLLRVLDSLWPSQRGKISRFVQHDRHGVIFIPQKPFLTNGTLRQQICFPYRQPVSPDLSDVDLIDYIKDLGLEGLLARAGGLDCPCEWNWYDIMSPGEMQRISFLRIFYHQPKFAVLDEATSQVSTSMERHLYGLCRTFHITVISVGHRDTLRKFHQVEIRLDGEGGWHELIIDQDGNSTGNGSPKTTNSLGSGNSNSSLTLRNQVAAAAEAANSAAAAANEDISMDEMDIINVGFESSDEENSIML